MSAATNGARARSLGGWLRGAVLGLAGVLSLGGCVRAEPRVAFWVQPMYAAFGGARLHAVDEVLTSSTTDPAGHEQYSASVRSHWLEPRAGLVPAIGISVGVGRGWGVAAQARLASSGHALSGHLEALPPSNGTIYENGVVLWGGNYELPDERQFRAPDDEHPSGWAPIDWKADSGVSVGLGKVGAYGVVYRSSTLGVSVDGGLNVFYLDHRLDRQVAMTAQVTADLDKDGTDDRGEDRITMVESARSRGTVLGPGVGVRVVGDLGPFQAELGASHGWATGAFRTESLFRRTDDVRTDLGKDGTWDESRRSVEEAPFAQEVSATVPVTQVRAILSYPIGPLRIGGGAFYALYRGVPVSPDFSYRDMTFKERRQDVSVSGVGLYLQASF
ncbi:hypothetical protein U7230_00665 [Carboxydochorda subterranea]|uniref:Uncharacterized protein n=1 Tax=Carboxydichorda subterranea TaxID=3109565 RepID=A0ABZ1BXY8_9FIRM|nr:hypothetical protein [Limnochorda sp. L945t]WRP17564.1 hypothetical protein U7230_00665 [Limnochorda sp. L945t]